MSKRKTATAKPATPEMPKNGAAPHEPQPDIVLSDNEKHLIAKYRKILTDPLSETKWRGMYIRFFEEELAQDAESLFPEPEPRNTITNQRRFAGWCEDYNTTMTRKAWALFGQLIENRVLSIPSFDFANDVGLSEAVEDVKGTVGSLFLALVNTFPEGNEL